MRGGGARVAVVGLVVGAVLVTGARAPHVITRQMVAAMEPGSVISTFPIRPEGRPS